MRILIADDDVTARITVSELLKKQGHEVLAVSNGADALAALQSPTPPRLAILDWMMPELDGSQVVTRIRQAQPEHPPYLIMLTIRGEKADIISGLNLGANDYLPKPFDHGELCARVEVGRRMLELQDALAAKIKELKLALEQLRTLHGILPICASCKKIRDDQGYWEQVEVYIAAHTDAEFSHSICPACLKKLYPQDSPFVAGGQTP